MTAKHAVMARAVFIMRPVVKVTGEMKNRYGCKLIRQKRQSSCPIFTWPGLAVLCDLQYGTLSVPA